MRRLRGPLLAALVVALGILSTIRAIQHLPAARSRAPRAGAQAPERGDPLAPRPDPDAPPAPPAPRPPPTEARLIVTVTGLDGRAAEGAEVTVAGSGVWPPRQATTGTDGTALFDEIPAGVYEARARTADAIAQPFEGFELARGEERRVFLALEPGRAIIGRVRDAVSGEPVAGAHVLVAEDSLSTAPRAAQTGADGGFSVEPVLERLHRVDVRAEGFVPRLGVEVDGGDPALDIRLHRGATVRGRVVDERGFPVAGAQLEVLGVDVEGGPVDLSAFGAALAQTGFASLLAGTITLRPIGELGVTVGPLPPIPGSAEPPPTVMPGEVPPGLLSGPRGEFSIEGVPPGRLAVHAIHPPQARGVSRTVAVAEGQTIDDVEVVLRDGVRVAGRILDTAGFPIRGATVEMRTEDEGLRIGVSDGGGEFAFAGLSGTISLRVTARDHEPEALTLEADQATEVELTLRDALPETPGRVVDDRGFPVAHATVRVVPLSVAGDPVVSVSGADGIFAVRVPTDVPLAIEVRHPDHATLTLPVVEADGRDGLRLVLSSGGGIEGTVRAERGGFPVAPFELTLVGPDGPPIRRRVDDLDGHFEETCLPPGRYQLRVAADGYAPWSDEVDVPPPRVRERVTAPEIRVELPEAVEVAGEVLDGRGDPVVGARVSADRPVRLALGRGPRPVTTDAEGRFTLTGLPARSTELWVVHAALGTTRAEVDLERGGVDDVRIRYDDELDEESPPPGPARFGGVGVILAGARVAEVLDDSEAERAGLRVGDVITRVADQPVRPGALARALRGAVGTALVIGVTRGGEPRTLRVTRELLLR